jgi:DNA-binding transcriptional ArsR family regulator
MFICDAECRLSWFQCSSMAVDQENVTKILSVLSHPLRRQILRYVSEKQECSFTDIMNALKVDTGKLSFHIRSLEAFLEQTPSNKYKLSTVGENALVLIRDLEAWSVEVELAKKATSLPLANFKKRSWNSLCDFYGCAQCSLIDYSGASSFLQFQPSTVSPSSLDVSDSS